jgi:hypothetical protein
VVMDVSVSKQMKMLGLIERLTKNADPVCTREKAKKKRSTK